MSEAPELHSQRRSLAGIRRPSRRLRHVEQIPKGASSPLVPRLAGSHSSTLARAPQEFALPEEFPTTLREFTKEVLRDQPSDIPTYGARPPPPPSSKKAWVERALTPRSLRIFHEEIARSGERGQKLVASARDRRSARPRRGSGPNGCYVHRFVQCRACASFSRSRSPPGAPSARLRRRRPPRPSPPVVGPRRGELRGEDAAAPGHRGERGACDAGGARPCGDSTTRMRESRHTRRRPDMLGGGR